MTDSTGPSDRKGTSPGRLAAALHRWDIPPQQAIGIQQKLRQMVVLEDRLDKINCVAGVDAGFEDSGKTIRAAAAVLSFPELSLMESAVLRMPALLPYIPGLLSFREAPAIVAALEKLERLPDLLLCDGQGIAHPRRFGLACHIGVLLDMPVIGVAKSRLTGNYEPVAREKGSFSYLTDKGERIGMVLRSRTGVKPLFVSPGHKISFTTAMGYVMQCLTRFRLPETTRQAHRLASGKNAL
ncbi:MAG: deoxyribonuclease V [Desulfosalsimonadaceae bacterium]